MAHFAECRVDNNEVIRVIVVSDQDVANNGGNNSTQAEQWVKDNIPPGVRLKAQYEAAGENYPDTFWKQTYKKTPERGVYAGISSLWNSTHNIFTDKQPFPSWTLDTTTGLHMSPIACPAENIQNCRYTDELDANGDRIEVCDFSPPDWNENLTTWICKKLPLSSNKMRRWDASSSSFLEEEDIV